VDLIPANKISSRWRHDVNDEEPINPKMFPACNLSLSVRFCFGESVSFCYGTLHSVNRLLWVDWSRVMVWQNIAFAYFSSLETQEYVL